MNAAATTDDEDFGDVSFLASFDVDQAVTAHRSSLDSSTAKENAANAALVTSIDLAAVERNAKKRKASSAEVLPADEGALLRKTLLKTFGYNDFREGQLEVIQALLQQRDAAVFWATGQGKSLCYQIPALHRNQVAIVVSPLISLMQDQCHKLNALAAGPPVAAFLGSAQTDRNVEVQAFRGAFSLVYLTPEKLVSSLDRFAQLHQEHKRICLIAIDEAHTVSEWGTDFRPDFRKLDSLRQHAVLSSIPLLALTASAVPRVQADITTVLQLHNPIVSQQSLDRKNLRLAVHPRPANPLSALQPYIQRWNAPTVRPAQESTIIYVATRNQVNELSSLLQQHVHNPAVIVGAYHAGLSAAIRAHAHTAFLTGQWTVLVATVAFGMGIDKPDTRRILHYGPPKTMEEYYQQIGRAGRDGAAAEAVLYTRASDFDKYSSDFYVGNLSGAVRQATLDSTHALRDYALCRSHCRRKGLLAYFGEVPSWTMCQNCDFCQQVATFGDDMQRDFRTLGAAFILDVVQSLKEQSLSHIQRALKGDCLEDYRCRVPASQLQERVRTSRQALPTKLPAAYFEQLLNLLLQHKYVCTKQVSGTAGGFSRSWMVYEVTPLGSQALQSQAPISLPVPEYLRDVEKREEARRQKIMADLEKGGFQEKIPASELEKGDGDVIRAYSKWQNYIETARGLNKTERVVQLERLLSSIEAWRTRMATQYEMAPVSVIPEHIMVSIAYAVASSPSGSKLTADSLVAAGVRSREMNSLLAVLAEWVDDAQPKATVEATESNMRRMSLDKIPPRPPWQFAVYKAQKKTNLAAWEQSYNRYTEGESIQAIAMSPAAGRQPIQVKTVAGHILDAVIHGRPVDPSGLFDAMPPPTQTEWEKLIEAHATAEMDPCADPETSGTGGSKYTLTDAIRPIVLGVADIPFAERSDADKAVLGHWYDRLKWFISLKRGGVEPEFL